MATTQAVMDRILTARQLCTEENMCSAFNIVTLGPAASGKSTFWTSSLYPFISHNHWGFRIEPETFGPKAEQQKDALINQFKKNYKEVCEGKPLPATARKTEIRLKVFYEDEYLFSFRSIDYRGGSVDPQNVNAQNTMDLDEIVNTLRSEETVAALVLADAEQFAKKPEIVKSQLTFSREILREAYRDLPDRGLQLTLALTKVDSFGIDSRFFSRKWNHGRLLSRCRDVFDDVFNPYVRSHPATDGLVVPISTFGMSGERRGNTYRVRPGTTSMQSFQLQIPLISTFRTVLECLQMQLTLAVDDATKEKNKAEKVYYKYSWFDKLLGAGAKEATALESARDVAYKYSSKLATVKKALETTSVLRPVVFYPLR